MAYHVANRMMRRVFGRNQPFSLPLALSLSHFVQKGELVRKAKPVVPFFIVALQHVYLSFIHVWFSFLILSHSSLLYVWWSFVVTASLCGSSSHHSPLV